MAWKKVETLADFFAMQSSDAGFFFLHPALLETL